MIFEQFGNVYSIVMNLAGLMISLFQYVKKPRKVWIYVIIFSLFTLLSNYYWGVYMLVMGDYPNVSSILAYFGWNMGFLVIPIILWLLRCDEEKHFFSPLSLLPIPLNIYQLKLYLTFGGVFNNIWQGFFATLAICMSINSIVFYYKNRKKNAKVPYMAFVIFFYITMEYIMWTSSCFDWPSDWLYPYNYAVLLDMLCYVLMACAVNKTYSAEGEDGEEVIDVRLQRIFKPLYIALVSFFCLGGYLLAIWMRNTLMSGISQIDEGSDPYRVIAVMLFVVSVVIVSFSITVVLVVNFAQKSAESKIFKEEKLLAERSNAAKSDFLANMSHEIRTPINAVLGMNEMILKESLQARDSLPNDRDMIKGVFSSICSYSGNIDSAGKNLLSIINDILDFSKIEAGKLKLVDSGYKLSSVLNDVSNMISFKAKNKKLEFNIDVEEKTPDGLYGDEVRIRQVITNLLNNAVKYTQEGSIRLCVEHKDYPSETHERMTDLIIKVEDTGIGIKQEDIDKLFNKFERVDLKKNSTVEGTGLGLAITKSLLELMGGSVSVQSKYGSGSSFTAVIPQKIISDEPIGDFKAKFEKSISSMKAQKESFYAPDAYILVVDDTRMNLAVVKGLLKDTGMNIDTAGSGREAIEMAKKSEYDLILMDQRMPEMDGITAMRHIKEDPESANKDTIFICLTADAVSGARDRYISEGFDDYLTKPIDSRALENMLIRYLPDDLLGKKAENKELLDKDAAGQYSTDDEMYNSLLEAYLQESKTKIPMIEKYYEKKDWKNYGAVVHAVKSTSRMIGSMELADIAARLEAASNNGDIDTIINEHEGMLKRYREVLDFISSSTKIDTKKNNMGAILEFAPINDADQ